MLNKGLPSASHLALSACWNAELIVGAEATTLDHEMEAQC